MEIYGDAICIIILSENTKAKRSQAKKNSRQVRKLVLIPEKSSCLDSSLRTNRPWILKLKEV